MHIVTALLGRSLQMTTELRGAASPQLVQKRLRCIGDRVVGQVS